MHDIRAIRDDPQGFEHALARRGVTASPEKLTVIIKELAESRKAQEALRTASNKRAHDAFEAAKLEIENSGHLPDGEKKRLIGQRASEISRGVARSSQHEIEMVGATIRRHELELSNLLRSLPNLPAGDVPDGANEEDNVLQKEWGERPAFAFTPRDHADLGPALGLDFEGGARIAGARFTLLRGPAARLYRALGQFMLDQHEANGHEVASPPLLVRRQAMEGTGQLPKFAEESFHTGSIDDGSDRWLIPTSEVSLTNLVREQIVADATLPLRLTALTPCFRSEAGAAGKDTRGLIRQHQFDKVELVTICRPEESTAEHERMTARAEAILEALELPYRRMLLCAGDMGFAANKTYDLEVWLPGQGLYREISSCSNCGDFQARRMDARYRPADGGKPAFVHTLNGSGLAVGRALVAVIENYQEADGAVRVPAALRHYLGGAERLAPA